MVKTKKIQICEDFINMPQGITASIDKGVFTVKGPKGEISRNFFSPITNIEVKENKIVVSSKKGKRKQKTMVNTTLSHIKNMLNGIKEGHVYKLKICASHFPMNVSVKGKEFIVENFIGEKVPRKIKIKDKVDIKIEGDIVTVYSLYKEIAGNMASDIEHMMKRAAYDRRIFQDGIYMISKDGEEL